MNIFHAFVKAFTNAGTPSKSPTFVCLSVYIFVCFTQFTLLVYKCLIMIALVSQESLFNWNIHFICLQIFNNRRRKFPKIPLSSAWKDAIRSRNERAYRSNLVTVKFMLTTWISNIFTISRFLWASYLQNYQSEKSKTTTKSSAHS